MARLNGARLLMLEKDEDKVVREIPVRTSQVQIGSNPTKNTIRLNSAGVEENHCKIFVKNDKVFIANYSAKNPISVNKKVVPKRDYLVDGSVLEICGTRFRWKFDDSKLARPEKTRKTEQTPTSSKFGNRRRTTVIRKRQCGANVATAAGGSGKKPAIKKTVQQKTPTYTLPKNNKQLLKNIRKRFTVHNIMTRQNSEDGADEDDMECEESDNLVEHPEQAESLKLTTPQKPSSTTSSATNTPFFTPEPEKENSIPVSKTPKTPMLQLENSAMMILSYTPAIGSRSKANIQKTPISVGKNAQRLKYLTPKNENVSVSGTPQKSKAGNSMYLIDLTTPNSDHNSFVCSPMLDTTTSSVSSPKVGLIDLTTPSPKMVKTPASALKSTQQKTLLKSALKNASRTPLRAAARTAIGTPVTPKAVPKISLNDTPTRSATSTRSHKTPASGSARGESIRSKLETPISGKKQPDSARKEAAPPTPTVAQPKLTEPKDAPIMTTDELFDTLVGRQSIAKTYERKSTSPKKTPCSLVLAEDTSEMPKTDIDLWVESVVAAVTSPEPVNMDAIIRKPNQTTQVRSSQYSDITPHESFAEGAAVISTSEVIEPQPEDVAVDVSSPDELDNMTDEPTIPNSNRRSETPLASKIARSIGNKRQTIGNFFTNIFGKLTVSPVTRISIADDSTNQAGEEEPTNDEDSDGSDEVYHDSETSQVADVPSEQPIVESIASSPKLRQSLRDTRKFIGNAWTSLNTSRPQLDNTVEIDESLLLSDTYNETFPDAANDSVADEDYDLTDLGSRPATAQPPMSAAKTPTHRQSVQSAGAFDISPLATPLESTPTKTVQTGSFVISPPDDAATTTTSPSTPVSRRSQQNVIATTSATPSRRSSRRQTLQQAESLHVSIDELDGSTVDGPIIATVEPGAVEDVLQEPSCSSTTSVQSNLSMKDQIDEIKEVSIGISETVPRTEVEAEVNVNSEEQLNSLTHLDTSEMEALEVTDGFESEPEVSLLGTPPANDLAGIRRAIRNSIATTKAITPKVATPTSMKVPLSESKQTLRGLQKTTAGTPLKTPQKVVDESTSEVDLLEDSTANIRNKSQINQTPTDPESTVEQLGEFEKSTSSCVDPVEFTNIESENVPRVEISHATVDVSMQSVDEPSRQELVDSIANLDQIVSNESLNLNAAERRSTRNSLATVTATPKSAVKTPLSMVPMSESKLPLRRLKATETAKLNLTVEESSNEQVDPEVNIAAVESNDELEPKVAENVSRTPNTPKETNKSAKRTPASTTPASPGRSSRSSARSTPQKASSSTPKSTPSGTAPLLKRVLQKVVKASATKVESALSPKPELNESEVDVSLQLDQFYQTPTLRVTRGEASNTSTPNVADASLKLDELYATPARATRAKTATSASVKSRAVTPIGAVKDDNEDAVSSPVQSATPRENLELSVADSTISENKLESSAVDKSLNLQDLYKTPVKELLAKPQDVDETPKESALPMAEADMSLNLQKMYQTPVTAENVQGPAAKNVDTSEDAEKSCQVMTIANDPAVYADVGDNATEPQINVDMSLNLQELYKTPAKSALINAEQYAVKNLATPLEGAVQADVSLNLEQLYKTPARTTRRSSAIKSTTQSAVDAEGVEPQSNTDITINLQELYQTPARTSTVKNSETSKESVAKAGKTPARPTRQSSAVKSTPHPAVDADTSKEEDEPVKPQSNVDMSLHLQELYKTPARTLRGVSQLTPATGSARVSTPAIEAVQPELDADLSLNLEQLYRTPARSLRGTAQLSAVKPVKESEVTPQRYLEKPAVDVTPIAKSNKVERTPIVKVSEAEMTLNLEQMYQTPVRQSSPDEKVGSTAIVKADADISLNLDQLYKTPAKILRGVTQLALVETSTPATKPKAEPEVSLNLQDLYKTPVQNQQVADMTVHGTVDGTNLFKTPARTTRAKLPRSSVKATPQTVASPLRMSRSASKGAASASVQEQPSVSMIESELTSSIVGESIDMGSESDGLVTGKAISSTPFNPRIRKSTLVAAVGMMSPLNSSEDATTTFTTSEMHTEAIGITTIDRSMADSISATVVDQMQTMAGVFVAAQSRLLYDESCSETMQGGDPLQVTNAVETLGDITCAIEVEATQLNETTQHTGAESLLEQNKTLSDTISSKLVTIDAPKSTDQSTVSTTTTTTDPVNEAEESIQNALPQAEVITPARTLRRTSQSLTTKVNKITEIPENRSAVENTPVRNVAEADVAVCVNLQADELKTPNWMSQEDSQLSSAKTAGTPLIASPAIVEPTVVTKSPTASPKDPSTCVDDANVSVSKTPILTSTRASTARLSSVANASHQPTPSHASNQRVSVTVNVSINKQGFVATSTLFETPSGTLVAGSPIAEVKSADNVPDVSVAVDPANASSLLNEKTCDESVPEKSIANVSVAPENSGAVASESGITSKGLDAAAAYLDSLGVDPVLLQQIHDRVDTLERELAEINDITQTSSTFLERSDEQSLDSQESEVDAKLQDKTPKPMKRRLYTKTAPDDSTPEHRESIGKKRVSSFYTESDSDRKAAETSSEIEEPTVVEIPVKVLPSRASRRKITTLSEDALAGASPELKFVKPKPPKVAITENPPQEDTSVNTSNAEQSDQETSLGRRKVVFNEHIQVKEINSPAFIGEIIKKTSLRGRNSKQAVKVTVDQYEGQSIRSATKRAKVIELAEVSSPQEGTSTNEVPEVVLDKAELVKPGGKSASEDDTETVVENLPKQSEEIVEVPVVEPTAKRSRAKKAPATKRTGSKAKVPVESATKDNVEADPQEGTSTVVAIEAVEDEIDQIVQEPPNQCEEIVETSVDKPAGKQSRSKKAPAPKRTGSRTKAESKEEHTEVVPVKTSTKRSRRGAKNASDVTETAFKEPTTVEEEKNEADQKVEEPVSKRVRHTQEPNTESTVEMTVENQVNEETDDVQATTKGTSRSRRGKKHAVETESEDPPAEVQTENAKPRSRRGGKKNDSPIEKVVENTSAGVVEPEREENSSAVAQQKTDMDIVKPVEAQKAPEETTKAKDEPRSRRGAKDKTAPAEEVVQVKNVPAEVQETKSDAKPTEEEEKSAVHSKVVAKKVTRRGRGAAKNETIESCDLPEASAANSLTVETAVADSTSHEDEPSNAAVVDVESGAKRSRRGVTKEEVETAKVTNEEQANEPASKRSRRAPKSKETHVETADQAEAVPKTTGRSRRGQKQDSVVVAETKSNAAAVEQSETEGGQQTQDERQEASQVEKSDIEEKPTSRGRGARKKPAEEQSSTRLTSPTLPPPAVNEQPAKRVGRQAAKRAPKKAGNLDQVPVEMSMNESHMVKTMLPESHTSTPLLKNTLNADAGEVHSGTRGRRAVVNPVIAALIEESTPRTRARRGASATPEVQVETPNTPAKRGRGRGAAAKAKLVEEETQSKAAEAKHTSTAVDENEPSTSTARSRGKKTAKVDKEVIEQVESAPDAEPVTKRTRKVPAKLRDDADDSQQAQSSRGRRGAKSKTEESNAATAADDDKASSAGPSEEEPKRKARATAAKRTVKKKATDLNEEDKEAEKEEDAPKSPPPKRTRKGAR